MNVLKIRLVIIFLFITTSLLLAGEGLVVNYSDRLLTINASGVTLKRLCEEISKKTNIEISLDKGIEETKINLDMGGLSLEEGMKRITAGLGRSDLAIVGYSKGFGGNGVYCIEIGKKDDINKGIKESEDNKKNVLMNHIRGKSNKTEERVGSMILIRGNPDGDVRVFFEELLQNDEEPDIRKAAAVCLGYREDVKQSIPILKNDLKDKEKIVGLASAHTLGKMNDDSGYDLVKEAIKDKDKEIREMAVLVLGVIGKEESKETIGEVLNDNNEEVRTRAKAALKDIELKHVENRIRFLMETLGKSLDNEIQYWAAWKLTEEGELGVTNLKKIRQDKSNQGSGAADYVLTERGIK